MKKGQRGINIPSGRVESRGNSIWGNIWMAFVKIHLVDKFLILFMAVLMIQSAYSLFVNQSVSRDIDHIDVVIRTSMAAIFGYFLSANFIRNTPSRYGVDLSSEDHEIGIQDQTKLTASSSNMQTEIEDSSTKDELVERASSSSRLQVFAASGIGLFCLVVLIVLRNFSGQIFGSTLSASASATVTQFRDFVSGCIGFLIGCPTNTRNQ